MLESRQKIEIPLKTIAGVEHKKLATNIRQTIENEYAIKYLERIGVRPNKEKIEFMLSNMPVEKALVVPVWTRSALVLVPERIEEVDPNVIKQIYTGSKDIEISKRKGTSFFGKGVSEPGQSTSRQPLRLHTSASRRSRKESEHQIIYVDISYPYETTLPLLEVRTLNFQQLVKPLAVSDGRLKMAIKSFCSSLSDYVPRIFDDTTGKMNVIIQKFLGCLLCRRLFGLLCHYVFWNIVHPFARRTLLAARNQHGQMLMSQSANQQLDVSNSTFARRKNMMAFTATANTESMKKMAALTANKGIEINPKNLSKGGLILNRAVAMINANRAMDGFGMNAVTETNQQRVGFHTPDKGHRTGAAVDNELQSIVSGGVTLSSDASLTSEEKEILYCQLEECLNKLHTQMGFSRQALVNARQGLVAGCHFIVNEILCTHYPWLGGKREALEPMTPISNRYSSRPNTCETAQPLDHLSDRDLAMIHGLRENILKLVNETLTDLLDPARVYCDKIIKELLHEDDKIPIGIVEEKSRLEKTGEIATSSRSQQRGKHNKYYATSMAVRAVFSEETNPDTRKFLGMNSRGATPLISGKAKRRNPVDGLDLEPSQMSNLTPLTNSLVISPNKGDSLANESTSTTLDPLISPTAAPTMKDFKTLFSHDVKEHPRNSTPKFNPNNSFLYRRSESIEKTMSSDVMDRTKLTRGLSKSFLRSLSKQQSMASLSRQPSIESETDEFFQEPDAEIERGESLTESNKPTPLNVKTKSKLMSLVVQRSKAKYQDKHILQYSRIPNARYREELLQSGS